MGANHVMRRLGLDDSLEDTLRYVTALTSVDASIFEPEVARQWLASAPLVAEWLEREGVIEWEIIPGYHDYYWPTAPGACREGRYLTGALFEGRRLGPRPRAPDPRPVLARRGDLRRDVRVGRAGEPDDVGLGSRPQAPGGGSADVRPGHHGCADRRRPRPRDRESATGTG